ncbi:YlbF/YmcA family competence regulator [Streptococcus sciuri]|uniref:UPF0342 protein NXS10_03485 n=1 Tax=Streptococcus sciuri TaxID=2973939 RepID=A0ABT2F6F7_9STRE|nr:YlbF/YmcA family competence regulator [Streptococcus sciuri]MCS4488027.1 YlbF/YmcA family competence regulator [Streptococcus sciuri]
MSNIYDVANQLERELRQLPEYKAVLEAKLAIADNSDAKNLWEEFTKVQSHLQTVVQSGQTPTQKEQENYKALLESFDNNAQLKAYLNAQQRLSVYVADIEKIIFAPLQELQ